MDGRAGRMDGHSQTSVDKRRWMEGAERMDDRSQTSNKIAMDVE